MSRYYNFWSCQKKLSKNKTFYSYSSYDRTKWLVFNVVWERAQNHAGMYLRMGLMGYEVKFGVYDTRHWDDDNGKWYVRERDLKRFDLT